MRSKYLIIILILAAFPGALAAQTFNRQRMDSLFDILAVKDKAMCSITLAKNGKVMYSRSIGYSYIADDKKIPATQETRYRIGSITKMFTAVMIFQLIEDGQLDLNTTIGSFFPDLPNSDKITVGNLLNHHSGIHNFTSDLYYREWMTMPKTEEEMMKIISGNDPDFEPGEKGEYSNSNYILLGNILEKITGQTYAENLSGRITSKTGLNNTRVGNKADISSHESLSYRYFDEWTPYPETDMSIPGGAGCLVSTPTDLTVFIEALFDLKLVSRESLDQMKTITDGYGMGMFRVPFYEKRAYGHNGGINGFSSNLSWFPDDSLAMAYCTNGQVYPMNDILIGVLSIWYDRPYTLPSFPKTALKSEDLDKYLGIWVSEQLPLKITITRDGPQLVAQATGQPSFPLQPAEKDRFTFDSAGIVMEFNPLKNEMTLKQAGGVFIFTRQD